MVAPTTPVRAGEPRSRSRASYSLSSVASGCVLVATIAGAIATPIKASAIKKSCIRSVTNRRLAVLRRTWRKPLRRTRLFYEEETPQRESPRLKLGPKNRSAADLPMNHRRDEGSLEIAQKPAAGATVLYRLPPWRVTKDTATRIYGN
jgi:hypothetical protein